MHFTTFIITTATIALASAKPAMRRQYGNGTATEMPTFTGTGSPNLETMPSLPASNGTVSATSSDVSVITSEIVGSTTLTYTLGPEGSSSVVTTVIESTSTITMTTTAYVTMTESDIATATSDPIITDPGVLPSAIQNGGEVTDTITNYLTVTKTITMESIETGSSAGAAPHDGTDLSPGSDNGSSFDNSNSGNSNAGPGLNPINGGQNGACSITTVTATIVEKSTVTVTPSSTDNFPVNPTATPSYGFGNGTDPTSYYPTASSGFLTFYHPSKPTKL